MRSGRSFRLLSLGPNEARIVYDFAVAYLALFAAVIFGAKFTGTALDWKLIVLPITLMIFNLLVGVYSFLKTARIRSKIVGLLAGLVLTTLVGLFFFSEHSVVWLWAILLAGPLTLPRVFLGLNYSKRQNVLVRTVRQRGPVLVVGGAGYIGSRVVDLLLQQGQSVRVLDRLMYGSTALSGFKNDKRFELIEGDATDITKLTTAMKGVASVVHLAGLVGDPACAVDPDFTRHTNIITTRMVKDVAHSLGVYRFVFASSCSVYGATDKEVKEGDALNPVSLYAQTKIDSEEELLSFVRDDFFVTVLRFATVFGHSFRPRFDLVVNLFTAQAMNDGIITVFGADSWRPFVHVKDLARAIAAVLRAEPVSIQSQIFNVGDKRMNMTIMQAAELVKSVVSKYRDVRILVNTEIEDRRNYAVSFDKIREALGFEASILMTEGIEEMAECFRNGAYEHYRNSLYSNVEMTKEALSVFYDPLQASQLYAPLNIRLREER